MKKAELPVSMPLFSTYHYLGGAGIVAKQNKTSDIWYFNNAIQWCCGRRFLKGYTSPEITLPECDIWSIPFLKKTKINSKFIRNCSVEVVKAMLDDGYYVTFNCVDDFYMQGKSWYNERHFYHDGLISGYDDEKMTFTIVAYDYRWIYQPFQSPQKCFEEGLQSCHKENLYGDLCSIVASKCNQELDIAFIKEKIKEYLNSDLKIYPADCYEPAYGVVVYDYLSMYIDYLKSGFIALERLDRRIFRLVWEHKKCMYLRVQAVEKSLNLSNKFSERYSSVVTISDTIRFLYSKFVMRNSLELLDGINEKLKKIKELEIDILSELVAALDAMESGDEQCL